MMISLRGETQPVTVQRLMLGVSTILKDSPKIPCNSIHHRASGTTM